MNFKRLFIIICVFLLLTGCSDSGQQLTGSNPQVLRVGMECNYAPFNWTTTVPSDTTVTALT